MARVSVTEAKAALTRLIERVSADEEIIITRRGKPIARLEAIIPSSMPVLEPPAKG